MALCLAWPTTPLKIWTGNPVIWCMAAMSIAIVYRWAAPFVLLKPSLFPFAFFGFRERSWWIGLAVFAALCLPFGVLWVDWVVSVLNSRGSGPLYSLLEAPMLLLPLVAWLGGTRGESRFRIVTTPRRCCRRVTSRRQMGGSVGRRPIHCQPMTELAREPAGASLADPILRLVESLATRRDSSDEAAGDDDRYREFLEGLGVAVYTTDADGKITFFNEPRPSCGDVAPSLARSGAARSGCSGRTEARWRTAIAPWRSP